MRESELEKTLRSLLAAANVASVEITGDAGVSSIVMDSRKAAPGSLFICMPGLSRESETFLPDAAAAGATAALVHSPAGLESARSYGMAAGMVTPTALCFEEAVWRICDEFFDHPTRHMKVVGVTGTNGKTTTAWLIRQILTGLGLSSAYVGTLGFQIGEETREIPNTTPFAVDLYNLLSEARDRGVQAIAMEASSHALAQRRLDGVEFDAAVFTNLTQDHLDFHGTMEAYESAKWRLYDELPRQTAKTLVAALNVGDAAGKRWAERLADRELVRFRVANGSVLPPGVDLEGQPLAVGVDSIHMILRSRRDGDVPLTAPLGGTYNVENLVAAVAGVRALGYALAEIAEAAKGVTAVPGRFEPVPNNKGIAVLVDYAHTPDALEKLLEAVRHLTEGKIITVFGCGGDRDRTKRPKMAAAASRLSDMTVVTSDNPRTEDPAAILRDVLPGIQAGAQSVAIVDRKDAINHAVCIAKPGDIVVIAGKGHENYQIIGRVKHPMDDRELARAALEARP